ncbi:hypothetical protein [Halarcobacter anaerophilus]|uniref:DUF4131 domain-containing protein n=1 Tax=Halarcobacter anaerophilus TaxID=877500 RepID=A0A4V1LPZ3_9BACT|nr:hypothetical protein [Halarcobacter anaerophilus]QDF29936.1 putative membrane protein [Halarcobacter anaerophilus]RXJ62898.1 hypothetical protein CRV06_08670 [Halarcobacter anaerophilus]
MIKKIVYFFLIYAFFGFIIFVFTNFLMDKELGNLIFIFEFALAIYFSIWLFKNIKNKKIKFSLCGVKSYIAFLTISGIFIVLLHGVIVYPTSFYIHKIISKDDVKEFIVIRKNVIRNQGSFLCPVQLELENNNLSFLYCSTIDFYNNVKTGEKVSLNIEESFLGISIKDKFFD